MARTRRNKFEGMRLVAKNPRKIKQTLRTWVDAADKVNLDPFNMSEAPPWVEKALAQAVKIIMPGNRMPLTGEWDMELLGEIIGRLQALGRFFKGEIPIGPDLQKELEQLEKTAASQPKTAEIVAALKTFHREFDAVTNLTQ